MSQADKLLERLLSKPNDFTFSELETLLSGLGYIKSNLGKTSGSKVCFINKQTRCTVRLHRPHHRGDSLKDYQINLVIDELTRTEVINDD